MTCKDCHIELKINVDLPGYAKGKKIKVSAINGIPTSKYWRARIKDSDIDGCVSVVEKKTAKLPKTSGAES